MDLTWQKKNLLRCGSVLYFPHLSATLSKLNTALKTHVALVVHAQQYLPRPTSGENKTKFINCISHGKMKLDDQKSVQFQRAIYNPAFVAEIDIEF